MSAAPNQEQYQQRTIEALTARLAAATSRAERAEAAIREVLAEFWQRGYPGRAALRTGWIDEARVAKWRAALDSSETPPAAPEGGHIWGSDGTWCRRCAMVRTAATDVAKWPCTGRMGVFRNSSSAAPVPEERSDEAPKKPCICSRFGEGCMSASPSRYCVMEDRSDSSLPVDGETP